MLVKQTWRWDHFLVSVMNSSLKTTSSWKGAGQLFPHPCILNIWKCCTKDTLWNPQREGQVCSGYQQIMILTLPFRHSISVTAWTALVCCCYGHNWKEQPSLLVLVDSYLGWFEIDQLSSLINMLTCQWLYSDNGTHYTSQTFPAFARSWDFLHVTCSPEYPQSNGLSKELRSTKKLLKMTKKMELTSIWTC